MADEDTNSIQTDNAKMAIQGNVAMKLNQYKWRLLVALFVNLVCITVVVEGCHSPLLNLGEGAWLL